MSDDPLKAPRSLPGTQAHPHSDVSEAWKMATKLFTTPGNMTVDGSSK